MHDGPHRTLPLGRAWRRVFERAENQAFSEDEVRESLMRALASDCKKEVSSRFLQDLCEERGSGSGTLFPDSQSEKLSQLMAKTPLGGLERTILEHLSLRLTTIPLSRSAVEYSVIDSLQERRDSRRRQAEEHYCQRGREDRSIRQCFRRFDAASHMDLRTIAIRLIDGKTPVSDPSPIRDGIDDGVPLPRSSEPTQ